MSKIIELMKSEGLSYTQAVKRLENLSPSDTTACSASSGRARILTMCQGGHVRSVALKYLLRYGGYGHDVIACGWEGNTQQTREMLYEWADTIIVMQAAFSAHVPERWHTNADGSRKLFCYDVGEDRFGNPFHPELQNMLKSMVHRHGLFSLPNADVLARGRERHSEAPITQ